MLSAATLSQLTHHPVPHITGKDHAANAEVQTTIQQPHYLYYRWIGSPALEITSQVFCAGSNAGLCSSMIFILRMKIFLLVVLAATLPTVFGSDQKTYELSLKSGHNYRVNFLLNTSSIVEPVEFIWFQNLPSWAVANGSTVVASTPINTKSTDMVCVKYGTKDKTYGNYLVEFSSQTWAQGTLSVRPNATSGSSGGGIDIILPPPSYGFIKNEAEGLFRIKPKLSESDKNYSEASLEAIRSCEKEDFTQVASVKVAACKDLQTSLPSAEDTVRKAKLEQEIAVSIAESTQKKIDELTAKQAQLKTLLAQPAAASTNLQQEPKAVTVLPLQPTTTGLTKGTDLQAKLAQA